MHPRDWLTRPSRLTSACTYVADLMFWPPTSSSVDTLRSFSLIASIDQDVLTLPGSMSEDRQPYDNS